MPKLHNKSRIGGDDLAFDRFSARRTLFRRFLINIFVFLLVVGGAFPIASPAQILAAPVLTINDTDSYAISWDGKTLYQIDGNNPEASTAKASVSITGINVTWLNGLALSLTEDVFYASGNGSALFRINPDGTATHEATLLRGADNAVISEDGTKYYYSFLRANGDLAFATYNFITKENTAVTITGYDVGSGTGGDMVVDSNGYVWFASNSAGSIIQVDPETGNVLRQIPITSSDGQALTGGVRGLSYLPNGKMLLSSDYTLFTLDPDTLSTTYLTTIANDLFVDLGSRVTPKFDPIPPTLESNKTVTLQEKAVGNNDATHPEVGDTLLYTVQTRNTVKDGLAGKLTITDAIPTGLEYVPGSLKVDGASVTDVEGDDKGHYASGKVVGQIGNVVDTNWHTVTFQAKVLAGQAGKDIQNTALVEANNIDVPDKPTTTVTIYPRAPLLESNKNATLLEKAPGNLDTQHAEVGDTLLYTIQTRNTVSDSLVENLKISDTIPEGLEYVTGSLTVDGTLVTDAEGDDGGYYASSRVVGELGNVSDTNWHTLQFKAVVQPGQAGKDIINIGFVEGDNVDTSDRPRNEVEVYPRNPQIESEKFAVNTVSKATYGVGDTLTYTIRVRGVVNDTYLENLTITDTLPAGLKYVPNSLKVDGVTVTDENENDNDAGYSVTGEVYGSFGNVKGTDWHTLQFEAVIQPGQGGQTIQNTALVEGDNIDQPGEPTEKIVVDPEPPVEPPVDPEPPVEPPVDPPVDPVDPPVDPVDPPVTPPINPPVDPGNGGGGDVPRTPVVESQKAAKDLNGGNIEVGDTIEYTIRARNTVSGSQVTSMVISDKLPGELEYVAGTLKVNGVSVTDNADGDRGEYANGTVKGSFGTVTDTAWYTLVFQAKIIKGEHGDVIKNVGEVSGSNLNVPSRPSEEITINDPTSVDPAPVMESGKEVKDLNGGTIQVGDVIEYTIRTRNTTPHAVKNLEISDELPSELKYVTGSLKVDGQSVTDAQDTDKGSYVDGIVSGQFGNITDTAWHTIVFRAEVAAGQAGQTIRNVGEVTGDNLVVPNHPYEDIIIGGGSGSNPGIPGDPNDGSSTDNPNNPGSGESDSTSPDSNQSGGSSGSNGSDDTDVAGESETPAQSNQSGPSNNSVNAESGDINGVGNKLPNTSTNLFNLGLTGFIALCAGLVLMFRKRKA